MLLLMLLLQAAHIYPVVLVTLGVDMHFAEEPNELVSKKAWIRGQLLCSSLSQPKSGGVPHALSLGQEHNRCFSLSKVSWTLDT